MDRLYYMQSTNFEFIRPYNEVLANLGGFAEAVLYIDPGSALIRLRAFSEALTKAIHKEERLPFLPKATFYDLIKHPAFEASVDKSLIHKINYIRIEGNDPAHGAEGNLRTAHSILGMSHQLAMYMAIRYYGVKKQDIPDYISIEDNRDSVKQLQKSLGEYKEALDTKAGEVDKLIDELDKERLKVKETVATEQEQAEAKTRSQQTANSLQWDEAKTRQLLIDTMLLQAGWDLNDKQQVTLEHPIEHQPTNTGTGFADYVLWSDNGKPLAVVEAKRSSVEGLQIGREQARMYADGLEKMTGQRPVIFYTNGYETFLWDDQQYNSYRPVYGFYSRDSLEYLIYQRQYREPAIEQFNPDLNIANRSYQIESIKSVASRFQQQRRRSLIVQATGTGKTRVAIAICELLLRTSWAKRILFLCDRRELRRQADDAFKDFLGSEPRCLIGEKNKIDQSSRIFVSTYQGMMNRFHQLDVGFFDLIIADESHRSIYNKYRDLFEYFDSLQIGLTATPVKFIARNTFDLFDCEDQDPTFEYSLDDAINNDPPYLVPFRVKDFTTEFLREGIHYNDLSDDQKKKLEEDLGEEKAKNTRIKGKDIGRKIFSESTDTIILENLMNNGIKDATGSLVGKTIIFAQRQDHAEHLEKLFVKLYPQYGSKVCKVIHNKVTRADALIDEFKQGDNDFRIAISVDMLDTGIDVPEVVNLVFAKPVRSWVKFWQMIGRGTRLCENLFGQGKDKKEFYIFDHYGNFVYFDEEYKEVEESQGKSLLQLCFESRLDMMHAALKKNDRQAFDSMVELIRKDINDLPEASINVRKNLRTIHELQQTGALTAMDVSTQNTLEKIIAPLMGSRVLRDKDAIMFDKLIAELEICFIEESSCLEDLQQQLLADLLKLPITIQAVRAKDNVINEVQTAEFWKSLSIKKLEWLREELRGIMKYKQNAPQPGEGVGTTAVKDGDVKEGDYKNKLSSQTEAMQYRRRLKNILNDMIAENTILQKIREHKPVKEEEITALVSSIITQNPGVDLKVLNEFYGRTANDLHATIIELVGIDQHAIENHFTDFLHQHPKLTHVQVRFMNLLKKYISEHGTITIDKLYEAPFTSVSHEGVDGVFKPEDVDELVAVLKPFVASVSTEAEELS